jgi:hypothetical protein
MGETYYTLITGAWDRLIDVINDVTYLSGSAYKQHDRVISKFPEVVVDLVRDSPEFYLINQGSYFVQPEYDIILRTDVTQYANKDTATVYLVQCAGDIIDKIRSYTTDTGSAPTILYWEKSQILDIDYHYHTPGLNPTVIKEAKIRVKLRKGWSGL